MNINKFPEGWNEAKVQQVIAEYDAMTDDEITAEDEAAMRPSYTLMQVPHELVPEFRRRIFEHSRAIGNLAGRERV